ncbi:hypothetical protein [Streptosporangium sp. NPDC002524]|uniref:hypothetical protein n=1 Tax=Streptosporangium sp. NPDC002524 TaxID=3154537 RepID=UPI00333285CB
MTALRLHLRTSPLRWILLPLVALPLAILLSQPGSWVGSWPETGAAVQLSAFFLSVVAAGAAAWMSGSSSRHGLDEQTAAAAVPAARAEAYRLGATTVLLLVPYLIAAAVGFAFTARTFPAGIQLWFGYVLMGTVVMLLAVAWGWALGRYFDPAYSALIALLSWFAFRAFPGETVDLGVVNGPAWRQPDTEALLVRFVFAAVFLAAIVWAPRRPMRRRPNWKGLVFPVTGAAAAVIATMTTTGVSDRHIPENPLCVAGEVEMCLWPEDSRHVPVVEALDGRLSTLPAFWRLPERLHEYGLKRQRVSRGGEVFSQLEGDFRIPAGSKWGLALDLSNAVIAQTLKSCDWDSIRKAEDFGPETLRKWLEFYLAESSTPEYRTSDVSQGMQEAWSVASAAFTEMSPRRQLEWTRQQLDRVKATYCG